MTDTSLIARLEAATEGSRELDGQIAHATIWPDAPLRTCKAGAAHYTTSIDAAVTLVPEGWHWTVCDQRSACIWKRDDEPAVNEIIRAETPALALCIACLKARQGDDHG